MLSPGDSIDIWVVEKQLGSGGMGSVYRCHNRAATRILAAIKVLDSALAKVVGAEERFIREAEILFRLEHPNIVKVRNVRTDTSPPYLEMEFVEGKSLEDMLEQGALDVNVAIDLFAQMCDAVTYLHMQGIRHRDIKPANVLIKSDGRLKLVDFGLAMEAETTRITQSGTTFGTVSYAPPEWVTPDQMDPVRWDIYAMGVVAWEMLTGDVAFPVSGQGNPRQQAMQVMLQKQSYPPLDPGEKYPEGLRQLIREMTSAKPEARPDTAAIVMGRIKELHPTYSSVPVVMIEAPSTTSSTSSSRKQTGERQTWNDRATGDDVPAARGKTSDGGVAPRKTKTAPADDGESGLRLPLMIATVGGLGALVVGAVGLVVTVALAVGLSGGSADRDVDVVVSGLQSGTVLGLESEVDNIRTNPSSRDAWVFHFRDLPVGTHHIKAVIGEGCAPACFEGTCPSYCGRDEIAVDVTEGDGIQTVTLALDPPTARPLALKYPKIPAGTPVDVTIAGKPVSELLPGKYQIVANAGGTPYSGEITVNWGKGPMTIEIPVEAPAVPIVDPKTPDPKNPDPKVPDPKNPDPKNPKNPDPKNPDPKNPDPGTSTATRGGKIVSNGDFSKWLATHPDWTRETAIEKKLADDAYLSDWTGNSPPGGSEGSPAVNVSYHAAVAYCLGRGGLAPVEAEPLKWTESGSQPAIEWRVNAGKAAYKTGDGSSGPTDRQSSNAFTGFRCAK